MKQAAVFLRNYFVVPSTEGFSAYRTGFAVHWGFSLAVTFFAMALAARLGLTLPGLFLASFLAVFLLWGAGVYIGIHSHYGPLPLIGVVVLSVAGYFTLKSAMANVPSHALVLMGLFGSMVAHSLARGCAWLVQIVLQVVAVKKERDVENV